MKQWAQRTRLLGGDEHAHAPRAAASTTWHPDADLILRVRSQLVDGRRRRGDVDVAIVASQRALATADRVQSAVAGRRRPTVGPAHYRWRSGQHQCIHADWRHQRSPRHDGCPHTAPQRRISLSRDQYHTHALLVVLRQFNLLHAAVLTFTGVLVVLPLTELASHALHRCGLLLQMLHVAWSVRLCVGHTG